MWFLLFSVAVWAQGPTITFQPVDTSVDPGNQAVFSVTATGTAPLTYQWEYLSGSGWTTFTTGSGFQSAAYTTASADSSMNGLRLNVLITDGNGNSTSSNTVTLTVNAAPSITFQPASQIVSLGNTAAFVVTATGIPAPTYVWQYFHSGWKPLAAGTGYNTANLTTFATTAAYDGLQFRVVVSNGVGTPAISNTVTLDVVQPPTISSSPANTSTFEGTTVNFSVTAAVPSEVLGGGVLTYQWYAGGSPLSNGSPGNGETIAGATSASLSISNVAAADAGSYYVAVTNTAGSVLATAQTTPVTLAVTPGHWVAAGTLASGPETFMRSVLLPSGDVMVLGDNSTDVNIFNPSGNGGSGAWTAPATLTTALERPTTTLLPNGLVLIAGGNSEAAGEQSAAYVFSETGGSVTATGSMSVARDSHTATLIGTGQVLVAGGYNGVGLNSSEIYDPASGTWSTVASSMGAKRYRAAATLLPSGKVLVTGGQSSNSPLSAMKTAVIYNPATQTWTPSNSTMTTARVFHSSTLLPGGKVLIAGGINTAGVTLHTAEIYDPVADTFTAIAAPMVSARNQHTATLLPSGKVLIAGGAAASIQQTAEYFDPAGNSAAGSFTQTANLITARDRSSAWLLQDGSALVAGGTGAGDADLSSAERFDDESGPGDGPTAPTLPNATIVSAGAVQVGQTGVTASVPSQTDVNYAWTATGGTITSGQGTRQIVFSAGSTDPVTLYCLVTSSLGIPGAGTLPVPVNIAPLITLQPQSQTAVAGTPVSLTVGVTELDGVLSYQWYDGSTPVGANSSTFTIANPALTDAGTYSVVVTNTLNGTTTTATSNNAVLGVDVPPSISLEPTSQAVLVGSTASFSVTASGSPAPNYVWQYLGHGAVWKPLAAGTGINTANLTTLATTAVYNGLQFRVVVSNGVGSPAISNTVTLTVNMPPNITGQPGNQTVTAGSTAAFSVTATATPASTYVWQYLGGGAIWKPLAAGTGINTANLTTLATTAAYDGLQFRVVVSNGIGTPATSNVATLRVNSPPAITGQPQGATVAAGTPVSFTVTATGNGTLSYQWYDGATPVGTNSASLAISSPAGSDAGTYSVTVTNTLQSTTTQTSSSPAVLAVDVAPSIGGQPANENVNSGSPASFSVTATNTHGTAGTLSYQWYKGASQLANGGNISGATSATLSLASAGASDAGSYSVVVANTVSAINTTTASGTAILAVNVAPSIGTQPLGQTVVGGSSPTFTVSATNSAGTAGTLSYQWFKGASLLSDAGNISGAATAALTLTGVAASDAGSYSVVVTNTVALAGTTSTTNSTSSGTATLAVNIAPAITAQPSAALTVLWGASPSLSVGATGTGTLSYQWYKGSSPLSNGGDVSGVTTSTLAFTSVRDRDAATYYVVVTDTLGSTTTTTQSNDAVLAVNNLPSITGQPQNQTVPQGGTATFSVTAGRSDGAVSYQWYHGLTLLADGGDYAGSATATLTVYPASVADGGSYTVTVTDTLNAVTNTATSNAATLTIVVGQWTPAGSQAEARYEAMSLMLPNGGFWVAGGQNDAGLLSDNSVYSLGLWTEGGHSFAAGPHLDGTATLLPDGKVLIAGGSDGQDAQSGVELYNPSDGTYTASSQTLAQNTTLHVAALLSTGKVLIAGGTNGWSDTYYSNAVLYDPVADSFSASGGMLGTARAGSRAVTLNDGRILIAGGEDVNGVDNAADLYYPVAVSPHSADTFTQVAGGMTSPRLYHTATLLANGKVLVAGGVDGTNVLSSLEIFDPAASTFSSLGSMSTARMAHSAVLLSNGTVLIFGGTSDGLTVLDSAEIVDPNFVADSGSLTIPAGTMNADRELDSATLLPDGTVLAAGGYSGSASLATAEVFTATEGYTAAPTAPSAAITAPAYVTGNLAGTYDASVAAATDTNYSWTIAGGAIASGQGTDQIAFTPGASGTVTFDSLVTNRYGISALGTASSTIVATAVTPTITVPVYVTASTSGYAASISNTASNPNSTYAWSIAGGTITSSPTGDSVTFSADAGANVTLYATASNQAGTAGSQGSASSTVVAAAVTPTITVPVYVTASTSGYAASISNTASNPNSTYAWSILGGVITSGLTGTGVTFTAGAGANVTLYATASNQAGTAGSQGSASSTVVAAAATPTIAVPVYVTASTSGYAASISNTASNPNSTYAWSILGGAITSSPTGTSVTFSAGAGASVTLYATASNQAGTAGSQGSASSTVVAAAATPTIAVPVYVTASTSGYAASISNTASNPNSTYAWSILGGVITSGLTGTGVTFTAGAGASVTLYATASNQAGTAGSQGSASSTVVAAPVDSPAITIESNENVSGYVTSSSAGNTAFVASQPAGSTYSWTISGNGAITGGGLTDTVTFTAPTSGATVALYCTVTNQAGTPGLQGTQSASLVAAPQIVSFAAAASTVTSGTGTTLTGSFTGGTGSIDHLIGTVTSPIGTSTGALTSTATYTLTVTNLAGDTATDTATVTVVAAATASLGASTTTPLAAATISLTPTFTNDTSAEVGTSCGASDISSSPSSGTPITGIVPASGTTHYCLRATNAAGDSTDSAVDVTPQTVTLTAITPANGTVAGGAVVSFSSTASHGATNNINWSANCGSFTGNSWTAPSTAGTCTITAASADEASIQVTASAIVSAPVITLQPASKNVCSSSVTASLSMAANYASSYDWFQTPGTDLLTNSTTLSLTSLSAGTYHYYGAATGAGTVDTNTVTVNVVAGSAPTLSAPQNVTVYATQTATFAVSASGGTGVLSYQWYTNGTTNSNSGGTLIRGAISSTYTTGALSSADDGTYYYVTVTDADCTNTTVVSSTAEVTVSSSFTDVPPTIVIQPTGQTATVSGSAAFSVVASGPGTLTYQWYRVPYETLVYIAIHGATASVAVSGATSATYTLPSMATAQSNDGDAYFVVVANAFGTATSNSALLAVGSGILLQIAGQPQVAYASAGNTVSFSVNATCTGCIPSYQWYEIAPGSSTSTPMADGEDAVDSAATVAGSATSSLTIENAQADETGSVYYVVVTSTSDGSTQIPGTDPLLSQTAALFVGSLGSIGDPCINPWQINGTASQSTCSIYLLQDQIGESASVYWTAAISTAKFTVSFRATMFHDMAHAHNGASGGYAQPGNGFTMILADPSQRATITSLGQGGEGLGAEGIPGFVLAFQDYQASDPTDLGCPNDIQQGNDNRACDPAYVPFLAVGPGANNLFKNPWTNVNADLEGNYHGTPSNYQSTSLVSGGSQSTATPADEFANSTHDFVVSVANGIMTVTMDGNQVFSGQVSMPPVAYLGFTGGTGWATEGVTLSGLTATVSQP
jgi:hypothetical protein